MIAEIVVPIFPESINDGTLSAVHKKIGETVKVGDVVADIETDKVMFEVPSTVDGVVEEVLQETGMTVISGQVIVRIKEQHINKEFGTASTSPSLSPSAEKMATENNIDITALSGSGKNGRVIKEDVMSVVAKNKDSSQQARTQQRVPMTRLRLRIAERLLEAQHNAAILTTFNEIDMQAVNTLRHKYREQFEEIHNLRLGFMSFFVKATVEALKLFPQINASIDGNDIVYHAFIDMGIAIGSPRGLVVPVIRDVQALSIVAIEKQIAQYSERAKTGKLSLDELTGGTFSITNGGVFGSMLSTPIINPPQSGILGMHKIEKRVVVVNDEMLIRPIMYVALSYDHRIIDGREAVQFLVTIKQHIEDPARMLLEI